MRIKNTTNRSIPLGGSVVLNAGQEVTLARDVLHITKRPIFKSYLSDKSIVIVEPKKSSKEPLTTNKKSADGKSA